MTIPPESLSFKEQNRSVGASVSLSEHAASEKNKDGKSRADDGEQETILYDVETYTGIKVKSAGEATPVTSHTPSQPSAKHQSKQSVREGTLMSSHTDSPLVTQSQSSAKHHSKQSPKSTDLYDFHSTQSQAVGAAIKDPNTVCFLPHHFRLGSERLQSFLRVCSRGRGCTNFQKSTKCKCILPLTN